MTTAEPTTLRLMAPSERIIDTKDHRRYRLFLAFPVGSVAPNGAYTIRGGVCWPFEVPLSPTAKGNPRLYGYAVLCGRCEDTGSVYIFAEREFCVLAPWREDSGEIRSLPALDGLITDAWATYLCRTWHYCQSELLASPWRQQIHREETIEPKPIFVKAEWEKDSDARLVIARLMEMGRLKGRPGGAIAAVHQLGLEAGLPERPEILALVSALIGLTRIR